MSQREPQFGRPKEGDLEKALQPRFRAYEEWRAEQLAGEPASETAPQKGDKPAKKGFGKMDVLFLILGVAMAMVWKRCTAQ